MSGPSRQETNLCGDIVRVCVRDERLLARTRVERFLPNRKF